MNLETSPRNRWLGYLMMAVVSMGCSVAGASELEVTYLANEGFLLRSGEQAVVIDAVFGEGLRGYPVLPAEDRDALEEARAPYRGITLALASHHHSDHFNAEAMARFLTESPQTHFLSTPQAVEALLRVAPQLTDRSQAVYPEEGVKQRLEVGGIGLTVLNLHHGRGVPVTQNLGLLIEICGVTVLHVGDTEASATDMRSAGLEGLTPDLALVPEWLLRGPEWKGTVEEVIAPGKIVAMHLPASDASASYFHGGATNPGETAAAIHERNPGAFVPLAIGDSMTVPCDEP